MDNMDFKDIDNSELIEIYPLLKDFLKFLTQEEESNREDDSK